MGLRPNGASGSIKGPRQLPQQLALTWTRDGIHLLSAGDRDDPAIRSWDTSTWKQAGDHWTGHDDESDINNIILNPAGTLLASASVDHTVRL
jgi:WD40 repeat protein